MQTHYGKTPLQQLESLPGYWLGRAYSRKTLADQLREEGDTAAADRCLRIASDYEDKARRLQL